MPSHRREDYLRSSPVAGPGAIGEVARQGGLAALREAHTPSGAHKIRMVPFSRWVTLETRRQAERLSEEDARAQFGAWIDAYLHEGRSRTVRERR